MKNDIKALIDLAPQLNGITLLHCHAGVSRSTAAALIILAAREPGEPIEMLFQRVLDVRPCALPNILMCEMVDKLLGRSDIGPLVKHYRSDFDNDSVWVPV